MQAFSSAVSITVHVAVGTAVLLGTTKAGRSDVPARLELPIVFPVQNENHGEFGGPSVPGPISVVAPDLRHLPIPSLPQTRARSQPSSAVLSTTAYPSGTSPADRWSSLLSEQPADILTGPIPVYPELLRQAGVQGRVVLEAVVDTTGRVLAPSILVVSATNPGFVAPARQALLTTLFRPAMVGGRPVPMRVRIPYEFTIRNGMGRAR